MTPNSARERKQHRTEQRTPSGTEREREGEIEREREGERGRERGTERWSRVLPSKVHQALDGLDSMEKADGQTHHRNERKKRETHVRERERERERERDTSERERQRHVREREREKEREPIHGHERRKSAPLRSYLKKKYRRPLGSSICRKGVSLTS